MIIGLGIDVVDVSRMSTRCEDLRFLKKFLHEQELSEILESAESRAQLTASRFAVKEAFAKALGTGMRGLSFTDIQLDHDKLGKPLLMLHGSAKRRVDELGEVSIHVSVSHDISAAAAVVILEVS
jgi:holo-[acyl-carrier-protein] synthase